MQKGLPGFTWRPGRPRTRTPCRPSGCRRSRWRTRHRGTGTQPPTLVAERNGEILGFVAVGASRDPGTDGELFAIYVHPDHWGTGVGHALIEAGEAELRRLGHKDSILWVLDDNPRARRFYELAGWSPDGEARDIRIFGFDVSEVRYAKGL